MRSTGRGGRCSKRSMGSEIIISWEKRRWIWHAVLSQDREMLPTFFRDDAVIRWHCSNERFTVAEYIRANCEYPGSWRGDIERIEMAGSTVVLAGRVYPVDESASYHVVSFIRTEQGLISELDEYWADDGEAPAWRRHMGIGRPVREPRQIAAGRDTLGGIKD